MENSEFSSSSGEHFENSPLLFHPSPKGVSEGQWLGEEDSWSEEDEIPEDSEEEEYLAYGEEDDADYEAPDDRILMGLDEDYVSDYDSNELLSEEEIADVSAWEIFVHNCRR